MGSYQCAVLSEDHQTLSEEGSVQLEGESTCSSPSRQKEIFSSRSLLTPSLPARSASLLGGTAAHDHGGQRVPEPELRGPRTSRTGPAHLAAGRRSSQLPQRPSGPFAVHAQPHR